MRARRAGTDTASHPRARAATWNRAVLGLRGPRGVGAGRAVPMDTGPPGGVTLEAVMGVHGEDGARDRPGAGACRLGWLGAFAPHAAACASGRTGAGACRLGWLGAFALLAAACASGEGRLDGGEASSPEASVRRDGGPSAALDAPIGAPADAGESVPPLPWADDPCAALDVGSDPFADVVAAYARQDDLAPPPPGGLVLAGSSTIRRWRSAARALSSFDPLQRGVGGARLADVAAHATTLILRHAPRGVLIFAGTNDLADGRAPGEVIDAYRCLVTRVHAGAPGVPLLYVGITPTPARWPLWPVAEQVNAEVRRLASLHPSLHYVDVPGVFLSTGSPPAAGLFLEDGLHLSAEGYARFESAVLPAVGAILAPSPRPTPTGPAPGTLIRVDLGPSNPEDGAPAPAVDAFGIAWNAWHPLAGGAQAHAGEALRGLRSTRGASSEVALVLTGGFRANGLRNGGLVSPSGARLGTLAVPEATADFFYSGDPDDAAGLMFEGLDPLGRYTLRLFASRSSADEERQTAFTVHGGSAARSATVRTTGPDLGAGGYDGNDAEVTVLEGLVPDARGRLFVDVDRRLGAYCYVNLIELEAP